MDGYMRWDLINLLGAQRLHSPITLDGKKVFSSYLLELAIVLYIRHPI